ncbi:MAG TPA: DUF6544 family protein [Gaiellaceae bacterium]|nr:DUF6544 family protein [Gaiellaceae bacterium]
MTASPAVPERVRRYLERNLATDAAPQRVRLRQVGEMQLKPGRWLSFTAEQEVTIPRVAFCWRAQFRLAPCISLHVDDWYRDERGGLDGRLRGRLPVMRARGGDVARAEAMRYLAELPWAPQAMARNDALTWHERDAQTVEVATSVGGTPASVLLTFDAAGDIVAASSSARPRRVGKQIVETPFTGVYRDYEELAGVRMPTRAEVSWLLPDGPFTYFRGCVTAACFE